MSSSNVIVLRLTKCLSTKLTVTTKKALAKQKRQLAEANRAVKSRQSGEKTLANEMFVLSESEEN